jgi:NADH:ubiquinone oxidoreductase subunit F (NADH-binding)
VSMAAAVQGSAVLPRLLASDGPTLEAHLHRWGHRPAGWPGLIDEVERAGLTGRGGAAIPAARKLLSVATAARRSRRLPVVLANGTEGEPASAKDKVLLAVAPHLVLDGASIAAECVGGVDAIVCVDRRAGKVLRTLQEALDERARAGEDRVNLRVSAAPSSYVAGEESALIHWLNGGEAKPTFAARPFERGVGGNPTLVSNVETLAHMALIARFGAAWFGGDVIGSL